MRTINPATEEVLRQYPEHSRDEVERRLRDAQRAFAPWRRTGFTERANPMRLKGALGTPAS
jgi:acyl-CoA reductase-like NAD-dependent aldehyde dehydrogenase